MVPEVGAWAGFYTTDSGGNTLGIHDRSAAGAALVMAADEFHSGGLSAPGAAVGQQECQATAHVLRASQ